MLGITEPHPSFGFLTEAEWDRLKSLSPFSQKPIIKQIESVRKAREKAFKRDLVLTQEQKKEQI